MKKSFKVFFISLGSLIVLIAIIICIALWIVFTPERLTPIVRTQADKFITCQSEIGNVELTFFSSFPRFGLDIQQVTLINPTDSCSNDTLLHTDNVRASVDINALWKRNELLLSNIKLINGKVYACINQDGKSNFDIFPTDTTDTDTTQTSFPFGFIDINSIELENIDIRYNDRQSGMDASIDKLSAEITGSLKMPDVITADLSIAPFNIAFSDLTSGINASIHNLSGEINATLNQQDVQLKGTLPPFYVSFEYQNEPYLQNVKIESGIHADVNLSDMNINLNNFLLSINDLPLNIAGSAQMDTLSGDINTDMSYQIKSWTINKILNLIPPAFSSYLDGIQIDGILSSEGKINGTYNDSIMPWMDIRLTLEDGEVNYPDLLPFPLNNIYADITASTDLKDDILSKVQINQFRAQTPKSSVSTYGSIDKLFSDLHVNLETKADITLNEFNGMLPEDMKVDMQGGLKGNIHSDLSLANIEKMELEKINVSGHLALSDINVQYDNINLNTERTNISFALPNQHPATKNTNFLSASISSNKLNTNMTDGFDASLENVLIGLETSNVIDTTRIPGILLKIGAEKINAGIDTLFVDINNPTITVSVTPQRRNAENPHFKVSLTSNEFSGNMGEELKAIIEKMDLNANVVYNKDKEDFFEQWVPRGHVDIQNINISTTALEYPVEIPAVKMDFNPREFSMEETSVKLGASDFKLSGKLENIIGYFRDTEYLTGEFDFVSNYTDIAQIMALTSGIGYEEEDSTNVTETVAAESNSQEETTYSGPYMVPRGMDILLHTNIKQAGLPNQNYINNIDGNVLIRDGLLYLDHLTFETKGADMQLSAMYRTPRKNHLFAGIDFHLLNLEISELLSMIPDLDSIVPMLRSFDGKGEFHIVAETNMDSLYNLKMSQSKAGVYIRGEDLVLMDGEVFSKIAKMLRFNKKTENKVDSLSVEFTLFQDEIDVYPFMLVMDKYKVIVGGRHNLDMSMEYDITIYESPLPFRATLGITGDMDDMHFKLKKGRYIDVYRPVSQNVIANKQKEFMQLVRQQLAKQVVEKKDETENTEGEITE